jgi:hypothetical protein
MEPSKHCNLFRKVEPSSVLTNCFMGQVRYAVEYAIAPTNPQLRIQRLYTLWNRRERSGGNISCLLEVGDPMVVCIYVFGITLIIVLEKPLTIVVIPFRRRYLGVFQTVSFMPAHYSCIPRKWLGCFRIVDNIASPYQELNTFRQISLLFVFGLVVLGIPVFPLPFVGQNRRWDFRRGFVEIRRSIVDIRGTCRLVRRMHTRTGFSYITTNAHHSIVDIHPFRRIDRRRLD